MGAARESRPSEKTWSYIWALIPHLVSCLWYPLPLEANEYINDIEGKLEQLRTQLKDENPDMKFLSRKEQEENMEKAMEQSKAINIGAE